jgi:hypothetical protein
MSRKSTKPGQARPAQRIPWPLLMIGGGLILLAVVVVWGFAQPAAGSKIPVEVQGAPKLKIDRQKVDLGDVKLGQTVSVSFKLSNAGDQPLRFSEAPYIELVEGC